MWLARLFDDVIKQNRTFSLQHTDDRVNEILDLNSALWSTEGIYLNFKKVIHKHSADICTDVLELLYCNHCRLES